MVVCKCRKATRLYCFVHKVPVCGECICFPEHQICVVKKYSDWVVDGEYDWPPVCSLCHAAVEAGSEPQTTRLGCLHIIHTDCLVSHIRSFPPQTAPPGYACPECSTPIWPPKSIKDTGSRLHSKLKEAVILKVLKESDWEDFQNTLQSKSGSEKNVFGNHLVSLPSVESQVTPPAFASGPLVHISGTEGGENNNASGFSPVKDPSLPSLSVATEEKYPIEVYSSTIGMSSSRSTDSEIVEIDGASSIRNQFMSDQDPNSMKSTSPVGPGATTRKGSYHYDRQNSEILYYADDEDGTHRKYTRRGPFHHKFLRLLLPFWSSRLPTLPVTAPPRKDGAPKDDVSDGRLRHQRSSRMDPRKILLIMAIMACMATMGILYYRLAQRSLGENTTEDEPQ